jgi:TonB family protein
MHERDPGTPGTSRSANDRLKELWEARVAWSTVAAVAVHAALIGWAGFNVVAPLVRSAPSQGQLVVVPALTGGVGLEGRSAPVALPEEDAPEADPSPDRGADGEEEGGAGDDDAVMDLWAAAAERFGYGGLLRAEVVEVDDLGYEDGRPQGDSLRLRELAAEESLAQLSAADSIGAELDLGRLSEISPELAVMLPSMWILLRNPSEVERFLQRSYGRWTLDPDEPGSVTVTVWIDTRGSVEWAEVSRSSGRSNLDEAALALFTEVASFRPARHEGVSVSGSATFGLLFPW